MGQCFPNHVVINTGRPVGRQDGFNFRKLHAEPIVKMIVGDLPRRVLVEFEKFGNSRVIGREVLSLKFQCGHDAFALLSVRFKPCWRAVSAALTIADNAMFAWPESRQVSCNKPSTSG